MNIQIPKRLKTERPLGEVKAPWLTGRRTRWRVTEDWLVIINGERYTVPAGYIFDGASIPWLLWAIFPPSYSPSWEASCFHDRAYSHWHPVMDKSFADKVFRAIMLKQGAKPWIAAVFYRAVSWFGKGGW